MSAPDNHWEQMLADDRAHIWHPYAQASDPGFITPVVGANGVRLQLADGRELIDGMASWWCAIHGYNHPVMNRAVQQQLETMSHVMFGGLTHPPAIKLAAMLVDLTPEGLNRVFFSDSGSVSVEVAMKMAIQYWQAIGKPGKQKMVALRSGYHGDTLATMSVCDPVTGMHHLFGDVVLKQFFAPAPDCAFDGPCPESDMEEISDILARHHEEIAAVIVEPVVQGAGGMRFYSPDYLRKLRALCDAFDVLLIFDEIATGFGRTGKLFALEHAGVEPDLLCLGKSLTGGYMTLAATIANDRIAEGIDGGEAGAFMHGPTFMGNPLACASAIASIELLLSQPWQRTVARLQTELEQGLAPARDFEQVADVRTLGAIGVIELKEAVNMREVQPMFVEQGIWIRPFGKLVYTMPPFIMNSEDTASVTAGMLEVVARL
ncbi:adenosylmethionine-8-amino-7-oxononanoate aminotransferase [Halioglobus japonicus]|uniref:Adenosylmethionine-8-amino-7-oxononanoate aminotransferase n=1 Tax=Halioglobus japonicus TaxID=930805 RepID=A0AAP8MHJ6_9GAMM|nr:adenosylmethionine--8-amino-7-oxononanoate transaminase [Halioglobus japonicus]PLW87951.1 adenosylmethionine--8-amino-7-oxononanoate transaminase [Halioglobus japonicus]GHD20231.1 adenosylmethionine-8-amino-7-oxononanoate aminotransferase [Halioglobus japonicus]